MKRVLLLIGVIFFSANLWAQDLVKTPIPGIERDTMRLKTPVKPELLYQNLLSEFPVTPLFLEKPELPAFDFSTLLKSNWRIQAQRYETGFSSALFPSLTGTFLTPFLHSAVIFNQATYQVSDKITLGGNSFGARSIFSAPLPHPGSNQFDTRGATMFMQYKVSKNFKIETRVSVSGNNYQP